MHTFKSSGEFVFEKFDCGTFLSSRTDDSEIAQIIGKVYEDFGYVVDPHTACGFKRSGGVDSPELVLATAHPAKFPDTIQQAVGIEPTHPSLETLKARQVVKHHVEPTPDAIKAFMRERIR
jgi:threonine synthase